MGGVEASESASWSAAKSLADSVSTNMSKSNTFVDPAQAAGRADLFGTAAKMANPGGAAAAATGAGRFLMPGMKSDYAGLAGMTDPRAQIAEQSGALKQGLGELFREEINPAIKGSAIASGGFGGGRQGVAQGQAAGELADAYTTGRADIVAAANRTALDATAQRGSIGQSIFNLGQGVANAGLDSLRGWADILGPATVLSKAKSAGKSSSRARQNSKSGSSSQSAGVKVVGF